MRALESRPLAGRLVSHAARGLARVVALAGLFAVLLTVCGQLLARLWWPLELASHFAAYYALAAALAAPVLLRGPQRRPWLAAAVIVVLLVNLGLIAPYAAPSSAPAADGEPLRAMTLNVLTSNRRHDDVLRLIEQVDPDVLALIEVDRSWIDGLKPLFERYPTAHTLPRSDNFGVALFSRLPAQSIDTIVLADSEVPSIVAELDSPVGRVTVLATHPMPPIGAANARLRNNHLAAVAAWSQQQRGERLVMGDLNITPWSPYFRSLLADVRLLDSGVGQGLHATWFIGEKRLGAHLIGIPIDHVLHTRGLRVIRREVGSDVGSDHRAVVVDFVAPATGD
ncbi:Endonuclease/Exonuclease/phosphatase family protein [Posidoniimonas polymericola]|uniref:Endonuclease/Exonuclease/phosphatase family protein n=1 Tax=Posidoniimonas polymericola TaxID=2528002 RepID=A0A5C5YTF5_9BACT|nr:endonuclease/exonuclease/phosphatase family protein [Posidoniimonas polymericola]TWT78060.1 Endonuclease/Exonuclease/phosphatase family protein [Posidoniimonas polymericola]